VTGQQTRAKEAGGDLLQPVRQEVRTSMKPIANLHPRSGRTILYVSEMMTSEIEELPEPESEELLGRLFRHLYDPAILWTHEWQSGDLVIWDNLSIQHARGNVDAEGPVRTLRKVIAPRVSRTQRPESPRFDNVG
jgi:taurine dioxygenase